MTNEEKQAILASAQTFLREVIARNHVNNTQRLITLDQFNVNPFLINYLANFLTGNDSPESIARALVYPRVLGTSITTSFGMHMQYFCSNVLAGFASAVSGIDIEFVDGVDGRRKYCQTKLGPNTINRDDVTTIINHFQAVRGLARVNRLAIEPNDLIVGVLYGTPEELSTHYQVIDRQYPVYVGQEFWFRLTGDRNFYFDLADAIGEVANEFDAAGMLEEVIQELAENIRTHMHL